MPNLQAINSNPINGTAALGERIHLQIAIEVKRFQIEAVASLQIQIIVFEKAALALPLEINVTPPLGSATAPFIIKTYAQGVAALSLAIQTYNPSAFNLSSYHWKIRLSLDGIDVSENLTGNLRVEAEESTAKIAEFTLVPFAGPISVSKWIGKPIVIQYLLSESSGNLLGEFLLFKGVVDEPMYDPTSRLTTFSCTDQFQEKIENLTRQEIDSLIQGHWDATIFEENADNWTYARDQLSTLPVALDLDKENQIRLTPWLGREVADFRLTEEDILYQQTRVQLANRRNLHNQSDITLQYRYQRFKQREILYDYRYPLSFCEQNAKGATLPNTEIIEQAIEGTGWLIKDISYVHQRGSGWVTCGSVTSAFLISDELRKYLIRETRFTLAKRFVQTTTETYRLGLTAPQSINSVGAIARKESTSFEVPADGDIFKNIESYVPPIIGSTVDSVGDCVFEMENRAQLEKVVSTMLNQARTTILEAHRQNLVTFKTPLRPFFERHHTIFLDTQDVKAQGKIKHIIHECDFNEGSSQTTVTLAVSRTDDTNVIEDSILIAPPKLSSLGTAPTNQNRVFLSSHLGGTIAAPAYDSAWEGYTGNIKAQAGVEVYPERFTITTPEINAAQAPTETLRHQQYQMSIPNELLELRA
ncbi:MAG: hypothetical protein U1E78_11660 [Gammaproteobacteria bacterium]